METLSIVLRYEMLLLLSVLIVILTYKMLVQEINTNGLLLDKTSGRSFSPGGLQMLVVTLTIAVYYMFMVFDAEDTGRLPDMPNEFLLALGGSHAIFLSGKFYGMLAAKFGFASPLLKDRAKPPERRLEP